MTSKFFHRLNSLRTPLTVSAVLLSGIATLVWLSTTSHWGNAEAMACIGYAILASFFLLAQLIAFVFCHTQYLETVEEPKFGLLEKEAAEWASR